MYNVSTEIGHETSLNDLIKSAPCFFNLHYGIFKWDFEQGTIAAINDIENFIRFFWFENINNPNPTSIVKQFCSWSIVKSSPFLLSGKIQQHLELLPFTLPEVAIKLLRRLCVDNTKGTFNDGTKTFAFVQEIKFN